MAELTMKQMSRVAKAVFKGGHPLLIRGAHGIGKSEFVYQFAKVAGKILGHTEDEFPVIEMRASLMTEGDLTGLPYRGPRINGQESTKFNPPDWYLRACEAPAVLFFDEVDRGIMEVRQGIFQINDSRQLNGHKLHPLTRVVACINGGIHGSNYQVGDFDPAELDRYHVQDLEPTIDEWAEYCRAARVIPEIVNFCISNPKFLEVRDAVHDPSNITPSRRSWVRLSQTLQEMEEFSNGFEDEDGPLMFMISAGYVGTEAASAFRTFALNYQRTVDPKKVIYEGDLAALEDLTAADYQEFVYNLIDSDIMKDTELSEEQVGNLRKTIQTFPTESLIVFWQTTCQRGKFEVQTIQKLGWDFDNTDTEEEQVEFTKFIADRLIDPPEGADIEAQIEEAMKKKEEAEKAEPSEEEGE